MTTLLNRLRTKLLTPNSKFELWLRTRYHKFNATRFAFRCQDWLAIRSYQWWRAKQRKIATPDIQPFESPPKVTFLLDATHAKNEELLETLKSINSLQGDHWEIILMSSDEDRTFKLPSPFTADKRLRQVTLHNANILQSITGEYTIICKAGDRFWKSLLDHFYESLSEGQQPDLVYFDSEFFNPKANRFHPHFKPSTLSPALLLSVNYLSRGFINTETLRKVLGKIHPDKDLLTQEYDLCYRLYEAEAKFHHLAQVLVTQTSLVEARSKQHRTAAMDHLDRIGLKAVSYHEKQNGIRFTWQLNNPSTAIIIPSRNNVHLLKTLFKSFEKHPIHHDYSIHIVDNASDDAATLAYYQEISREPNVSIIPYHQPFNYSQAINLGVAESKSDLVLLMNNDMEIFDPDWFTELVQWAGRKDIGVVGGKLLRANHTIQHAGVVIGVNGFAGHIYLNAPEDYHGLFGSANWYRDYLAVTGACQMVRREVFDQANGYDEAFQLAFGDIDFCLRVHELGYRNIYTPFATLYHLEGISRGYSTPINDLFKGYETMQAHLLRHDPFFSPNLTTTKIPKCTKNTPSDNDRVRQIEERKAYYRNK